MAAEEVAELPMGQMAVAAMGLTAAMEVMGLLRRLRRTPTHMGAAGTAELAVAAAEAPAVYFLRAMAAQDLPDFGVPFQAALPEQGRLAGPVLMAASSYTTPKRSR